MLIRLIKRAISIYFICFLIACPAFADKKITSIKKGEKAPFTGTIFNDEAAADILIQMENFDTACQSRTDKALGEQSAKNQFEIDKLNAKLNSCQTRYVEVLKIKEDQIDFLTKQVKKSNSSNGVLWFAGGVTGGIIISLATAYAYNQISTANTR